MRFFAIETTSASRVVKLLCCGYDTVEAINVLMCGAQVTSVDDG